MAGSMNSKVPRNMMVHQGSTGGNSPNLPTGIIRAGKNLGGQDQLPKLAYFVTHVGKRVVPLPTGVELKEGEVPIAVREMPAHNALKKQRLELRVEYKRQNPENPASESPKDTIHDLLSRSSNLSTGRPKTIHIVPADLAGTIREADILTSEFLALLTKVDFPAELASR